MTKPVKENSFFSITRNFFKLLIIFVLLLSLGFFGRFAPVQLAPFIAIWVAAGIGFTALVWLEAKAVPIVAVSYILLIFIAFSEINSLLLPALFSILLILQTFAEFILIKRFVGQIPPKTIQKIIGFLAILIVGNSISGGLATLIIDASSYPLHLDPFLFAALWASTSTIIILVTLVILVPIYFKYRVRTRQDHFLWTYSALILSFFLFVASMLWSMESKNDLTLFREEATEMTMIISSRIQKEVESIQAIQALYASSDFVDRDEFGSFAQTYIDNNPSTVALGWLPIINQNSLHSFESEVQRQGFINFYVFEKKLNNEKVPVQDRSVYYPLNYLVVGNLNHLEMGYDFGSNSDLFYALVSAQLIGSPIATAPINLGTPGETKKNIFVIVPTYQKSTEDTPTGIKYPEQIIGFGMGKFDVDEMVNDSLSEVRQFHSNLFLYDISNQNKPIIIASYLADQKMRSIKDYPITIAFLKNEYQFFQPVDLYGRKWVLVANPTNTWQIDSIYSPPVLVVLVGMILLTSFLINANNTQKNNNKLRRSESMFRSLSDSALTGIIRFSRDGNILYANQSLADILGFESTQELQTKNILDFVKNPQEINQILANTENGASIVNQQMTVLNNVKGYRNILLSAGFLEDTVSANIMDITDVKKLNLEIQALNHAVRQMPDALIITDSTGKIEHVNPAFLEICLTDHKNVLGSPLQNLIQNLTNGYTTASDIEKYLDGNIHEYQIKIIREGIPSETELLTSSPIRNEEGQIIQYIITGKNITELSRAREEILELNQGLEQRVEKRTAELEKARQEMEAFSYTVSHDLRAPLRNMNGYSSILLEDYADRLDEDAIHYLEHIKQSSEKMDSLIQDLLKLSRLSKSQCIRKPVDMVLQVKEIINSLHEENPERSFTLNSPETLMVEADPDLLQIALTNLISNAWKFSRNRMKTVIEIGVKTIDHNSVYYIKDNGAGFNMKFSNKLFGVFQRLHDPDQFEGTGIGLATVKRIIEFHNGKVWAEGVIGEGATFYFTLPGDPI